MIQESPATEPVLEEAGKPSSEPKRVGDCITTPFSRQEIFFGIFHRTFARRSCEEYPREEADIKIRLVKKIFQKIAGGC